MYAQAAIKQNTLLRNGAYGIVMRGVQKCTCAGASLRGRNSAPLCCIKLDTATDPCMGSGHILVYAFDVLMQIYLSCGYTERDAAQNIVRNNLWGLDLDKRAYQLAYFAVMMKARQYDRRFLTRGIKPNLSHFQDLPTPNYSLLDEPIKSFVEQFENADTYGSLISVNGDYAEEELYSIYINPESMDHLVQLYKILSQRYDVVCTNPPYMAMSNANTVLKNYVEKNYPDSKSDLFAVFIERCSELAHIDGYYAMITQHAWMFLSSYEKLRNKLQAKTTINMAHLGARAFDEINGEVVQTTAFVNLNTRIKDYLGFYKRLIDGMSENEKRDLFLSGKMNYYSISEDYSIIPTAPIAYWISDTIKFIYSNSIRFDKFASPKQGIKTADKDRFLRFWHEVSFAKTSIVSGNVDKWFPCNKGGLFRKWYGNNEYVVNWENNGYEICNFRDENGKLKSRPQNLEYMLKEALTYTNISTGSFGVRYSPEGFVYDAAGSLIYTPKEKLYYTLGFLASKVTGVFTKISSPTMSFEVGQIASLPVFYKPDERIDSLVIENISISKSDWDSFETSWDFKEHPFIRPVGTIKEAYEQWEQECNDRRAKLKANEEELNRIFIDIYGLQDELTPEVEDKDITVRAADLQRDMRSFVSYAVGCMFGRYSLDTEGLAYAGGEWDESKYRTFSADKDNIIPICDNEYFDDDLTGLFVQFVKTVFGEETLEDNLRFIADALGGKGNPRTVIRNYFLNSFYADHCKTYQKRPIYWLFDSGKKNGFKALIYMHRYQPDTIARLRTDYVHEQQSRYRTAVADIEKRISDASGSEAVKLTKELEKLTSQADELITYEEMIHHLADQMIKIDLDDGVKHNYEIFKDVLAKIK